MQLCMVKLPNSVTRVVESGYTVCICVYGVEKLTFQSFFESVYFS